MMYEANFLKDLDHICIPKVIWVGDANRKLHVVREMV